MRALFIASIVLLAAVIAATPDQGKLRGLDAVAAAMPKQPNRRAQDLLGGLGGIVGGLLSTVEQLLFGTLSTLTPTIDQLLGIVGSLDTTLSNLLNLQAVNNALGLLRNLLLNNLLNLGGSELLDLNLNADVAGLVSIIANVNVSDPTSIAACIQALDVLGVQLNAKILGNRRLQGLGGVLGGLLGTVDQLLFNTLSTLTYTLDNLLNIVNTLDVTNLANVQAVVNALGLARVQLVASLLANNGTLADINLDANLLGLVNIVVNVDLSDPLSLSNAIAALDGLVAQLTKLLNVRRLQGLGGIIGGLLGTVDQLLFTTLSTLTPTLDSLLAIVNSLDVTNLVNVQAVVNALGLARINLLASLLANNGTLADINLDANVANLVNLVVNVDVSDPVSLSGAIAAVDGLVAQLTKILGIGGL